MQRKFLLIISILMILILSACGAPTQNPEDQASTAVAQAWAMVTLTQAAMPSPTPIPPTFTPAPTDTPLPPPTVALLPTLPPATIAVAATPTEQCNQIPTDKPKGHLVTVEFKNTSQGSANLAFGMNTPNDKGECFTYSFSIGSGNDLTAKVLAGCYWGYAWITGAETSVAKSGDKIYCLTDTSATYHIVITKETIDSK